MGEAEWLACAYQTPMLEFLQGQAGDRKLRLLNEASITASHGRVVLFKKARRMTAIASLVVAEDGSFPLFARAAALEPPHSSRQEASCPFAENAWVWNEPRRLQLSARPHQIPVSCFGMWSASHPSERKQPDVQEVTMNATPRAPRRNTTRKTRQTPLRPVPEILLELAYHLHTSKVVKCLPSPNSVARSQGSPKGRAGGIDVGRG